MSAPATFACPGKLFWIGEYAVLEGSPAVVAIEDRYAHIERAPIASRALVVEGSALSEPVVLRRDDGARAQVTSPDAALVAAVAETLAARGILAEGWAVRADSSALSVAEGARKLGLGSSAAVAAGLTRASRLSTPTTSPGWRSKHAPSIPGRARGLEGTSSQRCTAGSRSSREGARVKGLDAPEDLRWLAMDAGESASTRALMADTCAPAQFARPGRLPGSRFARLDAVARQGVAALERGDSAGWLSCISDYADAERALATWSGAPIMTQAVLRCMAAAEAAGGVAKPSPAGGGDVVVAFARTAEDEGAHSISMRGARNFRPRPCPGASRCVSSPCLNLATCV